MWLKMITSTVAACLMLMGPASAQTGTTLPDYVVAEFGLPPAIPDTPLSKDVRRAVNQVLVYATNQSAWNGEIAELNTIAASGDPRLVWLLTDIARFSWNVDFAGDVTETARSILGIEFDTIRHRAEVINHMMAWDIPAYPGYLDDKRTVFTRYNDGWDRIFVPGDIAWHLVDWGGVNIDDRPYDTTDEICHCIPAADNPTVSSADEARWLADDAVVFGIVINGEARAYPRRIMEIREMVNDTLGGRDLGIPYCTLCGAAQAYYTDMLPAGVQRPVLRTSGLLIRSNKVMYDIETWSVFDTFTGEAVTGPLARRGLQLEQAPVVTAAWGDWKAAHPDTTVLTEDLALGRDFDLRNTRDANGPIFPVGDVDPRLPVHEDVIGVITASGHPVAFQRTAAVAALQAGSTITAENVQLVLDAGGVKAVDQTGQDLGSHQAFWFAWSQFHPDTVLWPG